MAHDTSMAYQKGGKRQAHNLKRVTRTLATGETRSYVYHRPTMRRILAEPGTEAFEWEYADAAREWTRAEEGVLYLYFVQSASTGAIKIGSAADPYRRLQILQVGSPEVLTLLGWIRYRPEAKLERNVQGLFKKLRLRGEWFRGEAPLLEFIHKRARL